MPRHPPCALNNKKHHPHATTTTTRDKPPLQRQSPGRVWLTHNKTKNKDARVHYTVLTQHNTHTTAINPTKESTTTSMNALKKQQTTFAVPDTQQHATYFPSTPTKGPVCRPRGHLHPINTRQRQPHPGSNTDNPPTRHSLRVGSIKAP